VRVVRDRLGVPHVYARSNHDAFFMNGYVHASDRFFEMDRSRREADGTLAELLGTGPVDAVLSSDVLLRTIGLRRAARRSAAAYPRWVMADLRAYADGVNLWLKRHRLPAEYAALELTKASVRRWTAIDSIAIFKFVSLQLSFDSGDLLNTELLTDFELAGQARGFDGGKLFSEDIVRRDPFAPTATIARSAASRAASARERAPGAGPTLPRDQVAAAAAFARRTAALGLGRESHSASNWWVVSGAKTASGFPMLAADPHLQLPSPSVWHEIALNVPGARGRTAMNVYGTSFPGVPGVVHGHNNHVMWSSTTSGLDVTDFFSERVVVKDGVAATLYKGVAEPVVVIPERFRANRLDGKPDDAAVVPAGARPSDVGVPAKTLVVPRLNNGPLITEPSGPTGEETAIGVAYTGFAATRELEAFLRIDRARNLRDVKHALQFFDAGSQNFAVAATDGNIAYWMTGEAPLRKDLQSGRIAGLPPSFIRDGTGATPNGWIAERDRPDDQALKYEILPFAEMPHAVKPPAGFIANANNDPQGDTFDNDPFNRLRRGGAIRYLASSYESSNRQRRITDLLHATLAHGGRITRSGMARIQSDTELVDAQILKPFIANAYRNATAPRAEPPLAQLAATAGVAEAVHRLGRWDTSTPTGIREGYDASDIAGRRRSPGAREIADSVAATIYALWRSEILKRTIVATLRRVGLRDDVPPDEGMLVALRRLLDTFAATRGVGASGLSFFDAPGVTLAPEAERDVIILDSLRGALALAASPAFARAFAGSRDQSDYRWGRLHRITFASPLGGPFSIPPGAGFTNLAPGLPGLATDGGYETVDAASHDPRAHTPSGFVFRGGPSRRFVGEARSHGISATEAIAGGESGEPAGRWFGNQLGLWLTNEAHPAR
jgi:penicillin amidase